MLWVSQPTPSGIKHFPPGFINKPFKTGKEHLDSLSNRKSLMENEVFCIGHKAFVKGKNLALFEQVRPFVLRAFQSPFPFCSETCPVEHQPVQANPNSNK